MLVNLEVNQECPIGCKQCFCSDTAQREMDEGKIKYIVDAISKVGGKYINVSGGEPLLYSKLDVLLQLNRQSGLWSNLATSGYGLDKIVYKRLVEGGLNGIFISLNGSTKSVNRISRGGYEYAINALEILGKQKTIMSAINWVMQSNNAYDFPDMVKLAEYYDIKSLYILMKKKSKEGDLIDYPTKEQLYFIARYISGYMGKVQIIVESCFSQLRALLGDWGGGNGNSDIYKGCTAGIDSCAIDIEGRLSPCRHLNMFEDWSDLYDWWQYSANLSSIKSYIKSSRNYCQQCRYKMFCCPCVANTDIKGSKDFSKARFLYCPL